MRGEGCPKCAGHMRKTLEIFKEDLKVKNSRIVLLSEVYVNGVTKVHVKCADCGNEWSARPSNLLSGYGCPACARKRNGKRLSLSQEGFLQRMKEKGNPNVQVIGEYENCKTKILCKCRKCGFEWKATPNSLFQGHGCKMCASSRMQKPK